MKEKRNIGVKESIPEISNMKNPSYCELWEMKRRKKRLKIYRPKCTIDIKMR